MSDPSVEVKRNERGAWCVWLDGQVVSDHSSHVAARRAAQGHLPPPPAEEDQDHG